MYVLYFFFNDTATTEIYTLSLHDALPISLPIEGDAVLEAVAAVAHTSALQPTLTLSSLGIDSLLLVELLVAVEEKTGRRVARSEEHTSELQSRQYLVCRLLLEKKKKRNIK